MIHDSILQSMFLIFTGAAVMATVSLYARQALLVSYIAVGLLFGPDVLNWVSDVSLIADIAETGVIFLLFLLGMNLEPGDLTKLFKDAASLTVISSGLFALCGFALAQGFGYAPIDAIVIGVAMMFSSTIIGLKLLPTSALHHQHMGRIIVSVLLLQDMLAILALLLLDGFAQRSEQSEHSLLSVLWLLAALPVIALASYWMAKVVLFKLMRRFDQISEYLFLLTIGWCLGIATLAVEAGLSYEIGAFIAGVSLATNPVSRYLAESLKPLRDFFLIIFFFSLGAQFDLAALERVWLPALLLAVLALTLKPWVFAWLLKRQGERDKIAHEAGQRLGQVSEFSLLIAMLGSQTKLLSADAVYTIQGATLISFILSSYWLVKHYPTPMATDKRLRRD